MNHFFFLVFSLPICIMTLLLVCQEAENPWASHITSAQVSILPYKTVVSCWPDLVKQGVDKITKATLPATRAQWFFPMTPQASDNYSSSGNELKRALIPSGGWISRWGKLVWNHLGRKTNWALWGGGRAFSVSAPFSHFLLVVPLRL